VTYGIPAPYMNNDLEFRIPVERLPEEWTHIPDRGLADREFVVGRLLTFCP